MLGSKLPVGAGSAGGALATRLSEDPDVTVAVLEAGPDNDEFPHADVPPNFINMRATDIDWDYETEKQTESCRGLIDEVRIQGRFLSFYKSMFSE